MTPRPRKPEKTLTPRGPLVTALTCIGSTPDGLCGDTQDLHDVDVEMEWVGKTLSYRTRLCAGCRGKAVVVLDRGEADGPV